MGIEQFLDQRIKSGETYHSRSPRGILPAEGARFCLGPLERLKDVLAASLTKQSDEEIRLGMSGIAAKTSPSNRNLMYHPAIRTCLYLEDRIGSTFSQLLESIPAGQMGLEPAFIGYFDTGLSAYQTLVRTHLAQASLLDLSNQQTASTKTAQLPEAYTLFGSNERRRWLTLIGDKMEIGDTWVAFKIMEQTLRELRLRAPNYDPARGFITKYAVTGGELAEKLFLQVQPKIAKIYG